MNSWFQFTGEGIQEVPDVRGLPDILESDKAKAVFPLFESDGLNMKQHISPDPGKFNDSYLLKVSDGSRISPGGPTQKKVVVTLNLVMFQEMTCQNETKSRPLVGCVPVVLPWFCHW